MGSTWARAVAAVAGLAAGTAWADNFIVNPEFSSNLSGWAKQTGPGVYWAWDNLEGFPGVGAAWGLNARTQMANSIIVMQQCVPVSTSVTAYTLHAAVRALPNQTGTGYAATQWRFYPNTTCTGSTSFAVHYASSVANTNGNWYAVTDTAPSLVPIGAKAALVELIVVKESASGTFAAEWDHVYFGPPTYVKGDFDRDGNTDLVLRQFDGTWSNQQIWLMNGTTRMGPPWPLFMHVPVGDWSLVGVDDFDGDTQQDLLFQNAAGGAFIAVVDGNVQWSGPAYLQGTPGPDWRIEATARFDDDGRPDILWRNRTTGELLVWTMGSLAQTGTLIPNPSHGPDLNWRVVGARDFNGDYTSDLLWYNDVSGKLVLWFMDAGMNRITGQFVNPPAAGDANWKVVATGDYGIGPGGVSFSNDIVWRNALSGKLVVWYMDKAGNRTAGVYTSPDSAQPDPLAWTVAGPR